jgi:hypothetical protein
VRATAPVTESGAIHPPHRENFHHRQFRERRRISLSIVEQDPHDRHGLEGRSTLTVMIITRETNEPPSRPSDEEPCSYFFLFFSFMVGSAVSSLPRRVGCSARKPDAAASCQSHHATAAQLLREGMFDDDDDDDRAMRVGYVLCASAIEPTFCATTAGPRAARLSTGKMEWACRRSSGGARRFLYFVDNRTRSVSCPLAQGYVRAGGLATKPGSGRYGGSFDRNGCI